MHTATLFASAAAVALMSLVNAHGTVGTITVNGKTYTSPQIGSSEAPGPFFLVSDNSPVTDTGSAETLCGRVAQKSTSSIEVAAGSTLQYYWTSGYSPTLTIWPHNTGPMFFYMAKCEGSCNDVSSSTPFYKLQQDGYVSSGVWKQADLHAGKTVSFTIPADLEPGNYLIRHEVVNLALRGEMFPSCSPFTVTGSGTKSLSGQSTTFPGAYSANDPGLTVAGAAVYSIKSNAGYVFPGPPVVSLGQGSSSGSSGSDSSNTATTAASSATGVLQGAGSDPATGTTTGSTTASTPSSTGTCTSGSGSSGSTGNTGSTGSTGTTDSGSTDSTSSSSSLGSCADAWTKCNAAYTGSAEDQANYKCQTEYTACVAASMSNHTAKRMHRRRRAFFDAVSH